MTHSFQVSTKNWSILYLGKVPLKITINKLSNNILKKKYNLS